MRGQLRESERGGRSCPLMLPVGADRRVCWVGILSKTKSTGVDDQFYVGVRGRCRG